MDFRPIVAPSIRELFIQQVEGAILSGQLKPGDRLPTERELADTMHISKTVVHEACGSCTAWAFWTSPPAGASPWRTMPRPAAWKR